MSAINPHLRPTATASGAVRSWFLDDKPAPNPTRRSGISSIGLGVRLNAGGLLFEVAAVRALDGPAPRWLFDFGFRVGF